LSHFLAASEFPTRPGFTLKSPKRVCNNFQYICMVELWTSQCCGTVNISSGSEVNPNYGSSSSSGSGSSSYTNTKKWKTINLFSLFRNYDDFFPIKFLQVFNKIVRKLPSSVFLGLLEPDFLIFCSDPAPSINKQKKLINFHFCCLLTFYFFED
jgi:hypothetical protein